MHIHYTIQKVQVSTVYVFFISKEINTFIQQGWIKLIKSDGKDLYNRCSFEHPVNQRIQFCITGINYSLRYIEI